MQPGPASEQEEQAGHRGHRARDAARRRRSRTVAVAVAAAALCGLAVAARGALTQVMPRHFTAAQQRQIQAWEVGQRWRTLPAGAIFPAAASYQLPGAALDSRSGLTLTARRLGLGPAASCAAGAAPVAQRILAAGQCTALLRATYADDTGSMLVTVGVAVLPSAAAASAAAARLASAPGAGVVPAPVPGTIAAGYTAAQQQLTWDTRAGSYVIMVTAGYADGRPRVRVATDPYLFAEMSGLEQGVGAAVSGVLGKPPPLPSCPGAPGC